MIQPPENHELPEGWKSVIAEIVEHNTLCAVYILEDSETVVRIEPLPTDRLADYTQTHRVVLETPEVEREVIVKGEEVDDLLDSKIAAVETVKQVLSL
jgi:hypothetical protein